MTSGERAFTLIELLIVIAILAILGAAGFGYYANTARDVEITTISHEITADLRSARSSAINGEKSRAWGLHFVNSSRNYVQLYSTPTSYSDASTTIEDTTYLTDGVTFADPSTSTTKDILFARITGTTTASSITITSSLESLTVHVSSLGVVY